MSFRNDPSFMEIKQLCQLSDLYFNVQLSMKDSRDFYNKTIKTVTDINSFSDERLSKFVEGKRNYKTAKQCHIDQHLNKNI